MPRKSFAFTLIELLATIVLLGVIAFITYPAVNNIIKNSKEQALEDTVSNLENMAHLYSTKNSLGYDTKEKPIVISTLLSTGYIKEIPTNPTTGEELTGCVMYSWKYDQYVFRYDDNCQVKNSELIKMNITFTSLGKLANGGDNKDFYVLVEVEGNSYKWCSGITTCEPDSLVSSNKGSTLISRESASNVVCVIGYSYGDYTEKVCSPLYMLDKTGPSIATSNTSILKNSTYDLATDVTVNDELSGVKGTFINNPISLITTTAGVQHVTYSAIDNFGNETVITRDITVSTDKPTLVFTNNGVFNASGWSNSNFNVVATASSDSTTTISNILWCTGLHNCVPSTQTNSNMATSIMSINSDSNVMCAQATDITGNKSDIVCSNTYKIDKVAPILTAVSTNTINVEAGDNNIISSYFNSPTYGVSGIGTLSCNPINTTAFSSGNKTATCIATGVNGLTTSASVNLVVAPLEIAKTYSETTQTITIPKTGTYAIEVWGAQGSNNGGKGGYVYGEIHLDKNAVLSVITGGTNGYNGGGTGVYNGGGATTLTYNSTTLAIAAGGGGGATGTAGGTGDGLGGVSVGTGAGGNGINGGGGGSATDYNYTCGCSTCGGGCASYNPTYSCGCSTCGGGCASYNPTYSCNCSTCGGQCTATAPTYACGCSTCGGGCASWGCSRYDEATGCHGLYCISYNPTYYCNCTSTCGGGCTAYAATYSCNCSTCGGGCASYNPTYSCGCSTCGGGCASYYGTYTCGCSTCTTTGTSGNGGTNVSSSSLVNVTKTAGSNTGNGHIKITYIGG